MDSTNKDVHIFPLFQIFEIMRLPKIYLIDIQLIDIKIYYAFNIRKKRKSLIILT